jgi:hypothetical protein
MSQPSPEDRDPRLADAQVTGGGGHEPDPDERPRGDDHATPAGGAGVDLKTSELPDPE